MAIALTTSISANACGFQGTPVSGCRNGLAEHKFLSALPRPPAGPHAVEKGTKAVICVNFSACGKRRFNNLRANFVREIPRKEFFNTHAWLRQLITSTDYVN
jgi:hypothetical protein